jgi:hypothetical protein
MSKPFLRPEAGPVPYRKLQWRAKQALHSIVDALRAAVESATNAASDRGDGHSSSAIDRHRASRLFFVSGEPGSGKSTLYVTLREMLSRNAADSEYYSERYENPDELNKLKESVRWLEPIDLEVVGDKEENLLAAVLVRLMRELQTSGHGFSSACDGAIKELEELSADIGMAWESNLAARAGELDPDSYSMEVIRAQQARLRVNERLRRALNELAKNDCYGCTSSTLFVLPVDDLYLKPEASLQLLRLLRMISVPRLFFLIMGDITTVEALFTEKALADWTSVAGAEVYRTLPERLHDALARARELRARFLRKLLPPRQRVEIQPMDWYEAMEFSPERLTDKVESLRTLLARVKLDSPWQHNNKNTSATNENKQQENLFDFLTCHTLSDLPTLDENKAAEKIKELEDRKKTEQRKSREAYTGLQLLDATPREVMDLWSGLQELINKEASNSGEQNQSASPAQASQPEERDYKIPLLSLVLEFVKLTVDEQNFLNEEDQDAILYGVLPTRRYYDPGTYLEMDRLRLESESSDWKVVFPHKVWVRRHLPWKLGVTPKNKEVKVEKVPESERQGTSGEFNMLPPRQTAWIVLLHDLAWKWRPASINKNLVDAFHQELNGLDEASIFKEGEPVNHLSAWAIIDNKPLQIPAFKTVQELDCFLRVWNRGLDYLFPELEDSEEPKKSEPEARLLVQLLWMLAGWTMIENRYDEFAREDIEWFEQGLRTDSKSLSEPNALENFRNHPKVKSYMHKLSSDDKKGQSERFHETQASGFQTKLSFTDWVNEPTQDSRDKARNNSRKK